MNSASSEAYQKTTQKSQKPCQLSFDNGSLVLQNPPEKVSLPSYLRTDSRLGALRCEGLYYRDLMNHLARQGAKVQDDARAYVELDFPLAQLPPAFTHQQAALQAWQQQRQRAVVELPTGAGKTVLALMAIQQTGRSALVVVPTLDLLAQWADAVEKMLGVTPGMLGGGSHDLRPITITTYASALLHAGHWGHRFGLVVFDECHHLPSGAHAQIAEMLIAPFRLGLSATLHRNDGGHQLLHHLVGPLAHAEKIGELTGTVLAPYRTEVCPVDLTPEEQGAYADARAIYQGFLTTTGIQLAQSGGWQRFLKAASRSAEGREALKAFFQQKKLAYSSAAKFAQCLTLLQRHAGERVLVFTNDNATAYEISRRFLVPLITHQTPVAERREILQAFREGRWPVLATSKVLNEGVDVPAAAVAIIFSGNASVREHVQRLGRVLRREAGKEAVLYELVTRSTSEEATSRRRRQHQAYNAKGRRHVGY